MALTIPSVDDLYSFWGDEADKDDDARATAMLQMSVDLVWLATGLDTDPIDARQLRFVRYAIFDMAIYLYSSRDNVVENYSPFSSERIGSYSYSKAVAKSALSGTTGVEFFDLLVAAFNMGTWDTASWSTSEDVFTSRYQTIDRSESLLHPSIPRGNTYSGDLFSSGVDVLHDPVVNSDVFGGS